MKLKTLFKIKTLSVAVLLSLITGINVPAVAKPEVQMADDEKGSDWRSKVKFFGYGELHYNGRVGDSVNNQFDFHRLVLGWGYDFTEKILLRTELDFEHAFQEPELEFAYLDFLLHKSVNVRTGSILVPMGVINQHHEPPLFYSVERPELYRVLIPTSWQEAGLGFHGKLGEGFDYELYGVSSLDASGFSGSTGFRGGRGHVAESPGKDFGTAGRLQYLGTPGLRAGSSFFLANTGQGDPLINRGFLTMLEGDAKYHFEGIELDGILFYSHLSDADGVNRARVAADATFTNFAASSMLGWYVEGAYHLFHHAWSTTKQDLVLFTRFEDINTQFKMPAAFAGSGANDRRVWATGISYLPIPQVALKADYEARWNKLNGETDRWNLGVGFMY